MELGLETLQVENLVSIGAVFRRVADRLENRQPNPLFEPWLRENYGDVPSKYGYCGNSKTAAYRGLYKYRRRTVNFDQRILDLAFEWTEAIFYPALSKSRILPLHEVLTHVNNKSSPGYAWTNNGMSTKGAAMGDDRTWFLYNTYLTRPCYWTGVVKEELRPHEKINSDSLRLFVVAPFDHYLHMQRYCLAANQYIVDHPHEMFSAIGMNKYQRGWDRMLKRHVKFKYHNDTDISEYDGSLHHDLMWRVHAMREKYLPDMTPTDQKTFYKLYDDLINSRIVMPDGRVFKKQDGMPSGAAVTSTDDTIILCALLIYCWIMITKSEDYSYMIQNLLLDLFGDDNLYSTNDARYTARAIADVLHSHFGIKATSSHEEFLDIGDTSFLSHKNQIHRGIRVPVPDAVKPIDSLRWHPINNNLVSETWYRLCGLLMDSHFASSNVILEGFAQHMMNNHDVDKSVYFNPLEREHLYLGVEGANLSTRWSKARENLGM